MIYSVYETYNTWYTYFTKKTVFIQVPHSSTYNNFIHTYINLKHVTLFSCRMTCDSFLRHQLDTCCCIFSSSISILSFITGWPFFVFLREFLIRLHLLFLVTSQEPPFALTLQAEPLPSLSSSHPSCADTPAWPYKRRLISSAASFKNKIQFSLNSIVNHIKFRSWRTHSLSFSFCSASLSEDGFFTVCRSLLSSSL